MLQPTAKEKAPPTTGVIFVHGIGFQPERETLFDWARPIIDVLSAWRTEYDRGHSEAPIGENPVTAASVADRANPWIEVDIPPFAGRDHERWLLTEAHWAADLRAPGFTDAVSYLRRRLRGIIRGITDGYGEREQKRQERLERLIREHGASSDPRTQELVSELRRSLDKRWAAVDTLDGVWRNPLVRWLLAGVGTVIALTALSIYAPLRTIPIAAIRKRVEVAAADVFLVDWFGDLKILLDDPAQSAAVRSRVLDRARWLGEHGATKIVLVAHSGGAIVSYATLLRYSPAELPAAKLVTLGEGLKLGWRLERDVGDWAPGNSIRGDLGRRRPTLRWVDVWASYDPAPAGPLPSNDTDNPLDVRETLAGRQDGSPLRVESRPVTNLMHLGHDHGAYWENDEGFLIPLIRHIDDPDGDGNLSRFYRDPLARTIRTERRRRRVSVLLAWRWAAFAAAVATLLVAAFVPPVTLAETGEAVARVWSVVPGGEIVSGTIDGIGKVVATVLGAIRLDGFARWLGEIGPTVLGALIPILATGAIYSRGVASWRAHDRLERIAIRREFFRGPGSRSARSEGIALVGGWLLVLLAAFGVEMMAVVAAFVVVGVVSLAARAVG
jgi:hypothetical protein